MRIRKLYASAHEPRHVPPDNPQIFVFALDDVEVPVGFGKEIKSGLGIDLDATRKLSAWPHPLQSDRGLRIQNSVYRNTARGNEFFTVFCHDHAEPVTIKAGEPMLVIVPLDAETDFAVFEEIE
jgi:hypothetical protein